MQALKGFAVSVLVMLRDFVTSKKVLTAVLTAGATYFVKDTAIRDRVVAIGLILIGGQALADHGATAAKVNASSADLLQSALESLKEHVTAAATSALASSTAAAPAAAALEATTVPKMPVAAVAPPVPPVGGAA